MRAAILLTVRAASIIFSCGGNTNAREKSFKGRCHCRSCPNFGLDLEDCTCEEEAYNRETCCVCEDFLRSGPRDAAQLAMAALHSGCDLSERERPILEARTNDVWDLRDVALDLGISWKQALKIEEPLLAKAGAHSGGLPERERQCQSPLAKDRGASGTVVEKRDTRSKGVAPSGRDGQKVIRFHLQVEGNVIRIERVAAHRAARTVKP